MALFPTQPDEKTKWPKAILFLRRASWVCEKKGKVFSQPNLVKLAELLPPKSVTCTFISKIIYSNTARLENKKKMAEGHFFFHFRGGQVGFVKKKATFFLGHFDAILPILDFCHLNLSLSIW